MKKPVVECSPGVLGGTPVFAGTRVLVQTLIDYLEGSDTIDDFLVSNRPTRTSYRVFGGGQGSNGDRPFVKVLLDEWIDRWLVRDIAGHDIKTVLKIRWAGIKKGDLLYEVGLIPNCLLGLGRPRGSSDSTARPSVVGS